MNFEADIAIHFGLLAVDLLCFLFLNRTVSHPVKIIFWGLFVRSLFDLCAVLIVFDNPLRVFFNGNMIVYHVLTPVEYFFYSLFFYNIFTSRKLKLLIKWSMPLFALTCIFVTAFIEKYYEYNGLSLLIKYALLIVWVMLFLKELLTERPTSNVLNLSFFWIVIGILVHSSINIFVDGFANFILKNSPEDFSFTYTIYSFTNYALFCFFLLALYIDYKQLNRNVSV